MHLMKVVYEVRKKAHEVVAKLLAWSLAICTKGVFPTQGFGGEEFQHKSSRYKRRGSELAGGWRLVAPQILLALDPK